MAKKDEPISDFHKSLQLLAKKLTFEEYTLVAGTMFQLHAGMTFGYKKIFDPQILPDISYIWQIHHKKAFENKDKVLNLKVVRGGKDVKH
jgi:hypothetical protein